MMNDELITRTAVMESLTAEYNRRGTGDGLKLAWIEKAVSDTPSAQPEIVRCRDCKHFDYNHPYIIQGVPVLGLEVCNAWGDGCKTDEDGYCFLAERRTDEADYRKE